jgi:excisionase family DNA binding protein
MNTETTVPRRTDRLLTVDEVAATLKLSRRSVWRLRAAGELPAVQFGGSTRFRLSDVEIIIDARIEVRPKPVS